MGHLVLEHPNDLVPCCISIWNRDAMCGTGCRMDHILECQVVEHLQWLVLCWVINILLQLRSEDTNIPDQFG